MALLQTSADMEVTEYAAATLGNLAAGGQHIKDAIRLVRNCECWQHPDNEEYLALIRVIQTCEPESRSYLTRCCLTTPAC